MWETARGMISTDAFYPSSKDISASTMQEERRDCTRPRQLQKRNKNVLDTHSLLRFSRPVKAPLVSSIVPEISLWSRSLESRRQKKARNQFPSL